MNGAVPKLSVKIALAVMICRQISQRDSSTANALWWQPPAAPSRPRSQTELGALPEEISHVLPDGIGGYHDSDSSGRLRATAARNDDASNTSGRARFLGMDHRSVHRGRFCGPPTTALQ